MSSNTTGKPPRILSCSLCQHRKIKCDRNFPCSNCIKANVTCTPSTPAPPRKRRRPNQDLQQRLARCEELLQEYATAKQPSPSSTPASQPGSLPAWKSLGKLIHDDNGVRFMDSFLWANVHDELQAMREIIESEEKDDDSSLACTPAEDHGPDENAALILSDGSNTDLDALHPEPAHAFRLWQTFLDRVNPLTKVIHVPSVQPMLVEAAANRANLPKNVEALLFAIYTMSVVSMSDEECRLQLGYSKDAAYDRFSKGVRVALMRWGILKNYDMVILQALTLYLTSLTGRYDRHASWILNGVVIRIAQKMGLHRDGEQLGLSPFESEMRRRVWWHIILLDALYALMSGLGQSLLPRSWDTKEPSNVNDVDMFPAMKTVESREGPTDMIYCLVSYRCAKLIHESPGLETVILQNELGVPDAPNSADLELARSRISVFTNDLNDILTRYCDLSAGPVHELAMSIYPVILNKFKELICPPREQSEWGSEILTPKDNLFKIAVTTGEHSLELHALARKRGLFLWSIMTHFQIEVFLYMVGQLCSRTSGQLVDRGWRVTEQIYFYHTELFDLSVKPYAACAVFLLRAWRKREELLRLAAGAAPETPPYIARLQNLLSSDDDDSNMKEERTDSFPEPPRPVTYSSGVPNGMEMPWDQMLGFVDASSVDWSDMFGTNLQGANNMGIGPGMGTMNLNGWL